MQDVISRCIPSVLCVHSRYRVVDNHMISTAALPLVVGCSK